MALGALLPVCLRVISPSAVTCVGYSVFDTTVFSDSAAATLHWHSCLVAGDRKL
jgi:hypothetical protein